MIFLITEAQKEEILSSLEDGYNKDLYNHLRRIYTIHPTNPELGLIEYFGKYRILVDDKLYPIKDNKKRLVNIILYEIIDDFKDLGIPIVRKTIKKYLDDVSDIDIE